MLVSSYKVKNKYWRLQTLEEYAYFSIFATFCSRSGKQTSSVFLCHARSVMMLIQWILKYASSYDTILKYNNDNNLALNAAYMSNMLKILNII